MTHPADRRGPSRRPDRKPVHSEWIDIEPRDLSADIPGRDSMVTRPTGHDMRDRRLNDIQRQIGRGEYRVDTEAVADAIVRRLLGGPPVGSPPASQEPCS